MAISNVKFQGDLPKVARKKGCKTHTFKVSSSQRPKIKVVVTQEPGPDFTVQANATATLELECSKCGEKINLAGYGQPDEDYRI
jgi:hypothetical protein